MDEERIAGVLSAVDKMKKKGVTALKVELEAQMNRGRSDNGTCDQCYHGRVDCDYCSDGTNDCD
jgi:hypothetical protein